MMFLILISTLSYPMEKPKLPPQEETGLVIPIRGNGQTADAEYEYKGICVRNGRDYTLGYAGGFSLACCTATPLFSTLIATNVIDSGWGALAIVFSIGTGTVLGVGIQRCYYDRKQNALNSIKNLPPQEL